MTKIKKVPAREPIKAIVLHSDELICSLTFMDTTGLNHTVDTAIRTLACDFYEHYFYEHYKEHVKQQHLRSSTPNSVFCPEHGQFHLDYTFCPKCGCKLINTEFNTATFLEFMNSYCNMGRYDYYDLRDGVNDFNISSPVELIDLKSNNILEIKQDATMIVMGALLTTKPDLKKHVTKDDVAQAVKAYKTFVKENSK